MRKVIFLDIDGVLNSEENQQKNFENGTWRSKDIILDADAMQYLKRIVDITGAELVLSSTWRYPEENGSFALKENLINQLEKWGMKLSDETPDLKIYDRAKEILAYLYENPDITNFVILDDDIDLLQDNLLKPHILHTHWEKGLQKSEIEEAVNILEVENQVQF